jgi:hypothetical protein
MKASDNAYPSVLLVDTVAPADPPAGKLRLFVEGGALKLVDETGAVVGVGEVSAADFDTLQGEVDSLEVVVAGKANTTHTQPSSTITDFAEAVQDVLGAALIGSGVTVSYDDAGGTVTITGLATTDAEAVRDAIGIALVGVGAIQVTVDDAGNTITIATTATDRSTHTGTQLAATISDLTEFTQDTVANQITAGTGITKTYDDATGALTITSTASGGGLDLEAVQDAVAAMIVAGTNVTKSYDDTAGTLTIAASGGGGGGGGTSLFRGSWAAQAVLDTNTLVDAAAVTEMAGTTSGLFSYVPVPFAGAPPQATCLRLGTQGGAAGAATLTWVIPTGVTKMRMTLAVGATGFGSGGGVYVVNSVNAASWPPNTPWTTVEYAVTPGATVALTLSQDFGYWGTVYLATVQYLGPSTDPYMVGQYVMHLGKTWVSLADNNTGVPGTSGWTEVIQSARKDYVFTDSHNPLTTGVGAIKVPNNTGRVQTLLAVRVDLAVAPTGNPLKIDVNKSGVSIYTNQVNRPTVNVGEVVANGGAIGSPVWAIGETLTVDIDEIGTTVAGGGLTVTILSEG